VHDKKSNKGSLMLNSGDKYVGEFKNDKIHGEGVWYYIDGSRFIGNFNEGKCDSKGLKIWADGTSYISAIDSYYHSEKNSEMPNAEGNKYQTKICNDKSKNGKGTFVWEPETSPEKVKDAEKSVWNPAN